MSVEAVQTNEEYTQRLSNHDWEYSFSDEHSVWMRGAYEYKDRSQNHGALSHAR